MGLTVRSRRPMWVIAVALVCLTQGCVCSQSIVEDRMGGLRQRVDSLSTPFIIPTNVDDHRVLMRNAEALGQVSSSGLMSTGLDTMEDTMMSPLIEEMDRRVMRCMYDKVFRSNMRECEEAFQLLEKHIGDCDQMSFSHRRVGAVCDRRRFLLNSLQQRCVDSDFVVLQPRVCSVIRSLTLMKARMCAAQGSQEQITTLYQQRLWPNDDDQRGLTLSCEDNRHYAIQLEELLCRDAKFFERNVRTCDDVHRLLRMQMERCQRRVYYMRHQKPCEDTQYFLIRQQHKCVVDEAFRIQSSQICNEHEKDTILQQRNCMMNEGAPSSLSEMENVSGVWKHMCEDNMHYFVQMEQRKCMNQAERFQQQKEECQGMMTKAIQLLSRCDEPLYRGQHLLACDMQRLSIQEEQEKCNDKTFREQHLPACLAQREVTVLQQEVCNQDRFYASHVQTCNDNEHHFVQQKTHECAETEFHKQESEKCKIIQRVITPRLLEKCDDMAYYLVHKLACESLRYEVEKLHTVCCDNDSGFFATHEGVCKDQLALSVELEQQCQKNGMFAREHLRTCRDMQRLTMLQQRHERNFDVQSYIQINQLPMKPTSSINSASINISSAKPGLLGDAKRFTIPRESIMTPPSSLVDPLVLGNTQELLKNRDDFLVQPIVGGRKTMMALGIGEQDFPLESIMQNRLSVMQQLRKLDAVMEIERLEEMLQQQQQLANNANFGNMMQRANILQSSTPFPIWNADTLLRKNQIQRLQDVILQREVLQNNRVQRSIVLNQGSSMVDEIVRLMDLERFLMRVGDLRRMEDVRRIRLAMEELPGSDEVQPMMMSSSNGLMSDTMATTTPSIPAGITEEGRIFQEMLPRNRPLSRGLDGFDVMMDSSSPMPLQTVRNNNNMMTTMMMPGGSLEQRFPFSSMNYGDSMSWRMQQLENELQQIQRTRVFPELGRHRGFLTEQSSPLLVRNLVERELLNQNKLRGVDQNTFLPFSDVTPLMSTPRLEDVRNSIFSAPSSPLLRGINRFSRGINMINQNRLLNQNQTQEMLSGSFQQPQGIFGLTLPNESFLTDKEMQDAVLAQRVMANPMIMNSMNMMNPTMTKMNRHRLSPLTTSEIVDIPVTVEQNSDMPIRKALNAVTSTDL